MSKKSLLSLLLVMIMACCAIFTAGAEGFLPTGDGAFSFTAGVVINPDGLSKINELSSGNASLPISQDALNAILNIINQTSVRATIVGKAGQAEVLIKDTPIVSLAGEMGDDGITIVTDLLPSYAVYISNEELQQMMQQLQANMASSGVSLDINPEDIQEIINAAITSLTPAITKIVTSFGPEETGSWTFEGAEFTVRQPLNMTAKEVVVTVLEAASDFISNEKVQSFLGNFGVKPEQLDLSSTLESMQNSDEADIPALTFYKYANAGGDMYFTMDLMKDDQGIKAEGGKVGSEVVCHINSIPDMFEIDLLIQESGEFTLYTGMNGQTMNAPFSLLEITVNGANSGAAYNVDVQYVIDQVDFMTLKMAFKQGGAITASFDKAGKKILSLQDIMAIAQGGNTETVNAIKGELTTAAMALVGKLAAVIPNEITTLMTMVQTMGR